MKQDPRSLLKKSRIIYQKVTYSHLSLTMKNNERTRRCKIIFQAECIINIYKRVHVNFSKVNFDYSAFTNSLSFILSCWFNIPSAFLSSFCVTNILASRNLCTQFSKQFFVLLSILEPGLATHVSQHFSVNECRTA